METPPKLDTAGEDETHSHFFDHTYFLWEGANMPLQPHDTIPDVQNRNVWRQTIQSQARVYTYSDTYKRYTTSVRSNSYLFSGSRTPPAKLQPQQLPHPRPRSEGSPRRQISRGGIVPLTAPADGIRTGASALPLLRRIGDALTISSRSRHRSALLFRK